MNIKTIKVQKVSKDLIDNPARTEVKGVSSILQQINDPTGTAEVEPSNNGIKYIKIQSTTFTLKDITTRTNINTLSSLLDQINGITGSSVTYTEDKKINNVTVKGSKENVLDSVLNDYV